jgi:hypothetical protein
MTIRSTAPVSPVRFPDGRLGWVWFVLNFGRE